MGQSLHTFTFVSTLRMRFAIWLLRLMGTIELFEFKYLLRIRNSAIHLIRLQVRNHFLPAVLEGDDENSDRVIGLSALYLVNLEPNTEAAITADEDAQAKSFISSASDVPGLVDSVAIFLGIQRLIHEAAPASVPHAPKSLTVGGVVVAAKELSKKDLYRISKKLHGEIKSLRIAISDRKGEKISLDFSSLSQVLSLISICFLLSGYFYTSVFLSHFGVSSTHYFTISDYLASSVDKAESSLLAIVGAPIGMVIGLLRRSRMSEAQIRSEGRGNSDWLFRTAQGLLMAALIWLYMTDRENFYRLLPFVGVAFILNVLVHISKRYFHQPVRAMFALSFVALYGLSLFSSVQSDLERVKTGNYWKKHSETLTLASDMTLDATNLLLLYSSGQYLFLVQKDSGIPVVVPREKVVQVEINGAPLR